MFSPRILRWLPRAHRELALGLLPLLALLAAGWWMFDLSISFMFAAILVYGALAAALALRWKRMHVGLGAANRVTLLRGALVAFVSGGLVVPEMLALHAWLFAAVSLLALSLDGVDGWVARRTGSASEFGARFDMELDALFILVLCLCMMTLGKAGAWVVAIGAMRYAFVAAMPVWPWLRAPLPESRRRKAVCVLQVAVLLVCLLPVLGAGLAAPLLALSLAALTWSFAVDVHWLWRHGQVQDEAMSSLSELDWPADPRP